MMRQGPLLREPLHRANNPDCPQALWLRSTLLLPTAGEPVADVWVMVFDPDGAGHRALKQPYAVGASTSDMTRGPHGSAPPPSMTGQRRAWSPAETDPRGGICGSPRCRAARQTAHGPRVQGALPTAGKTMVRHPLAQFDGQVELDDVRVVVDGWTGSVNHNWGRRHTPAYAFGQVRGFDEAPESTLEIVTAHSAVGPFSLPTATLFVLRHGGKERCGRSRPPGSRTVATPRSRSFTGLADEQRDGGPDERGTRDVIGLTYTDTNGKTKYCYNSALATCRVRLYGPHLGRRAERDAQGDVRDPHRCPARGGSAARLEPAE